MSKLIRINTEDTNARFNETLSEDFTIEENSSIALQSATFTRDATVLEDHPDNLKMTFRVDETELTNDTADNLTINNFISTPSGLVYDGTNFNDLLANIQASMNNKLRSFNATPLHAGCEVRVHTNNQNKTVFNLRKANALRWTSANPDVEHTLNFLPKVNGAVGNTSVADRGDGGDLSLAKIATDDEGLRDGLGNLSTGVCVSTIPTGHGAKYLSVKVAHFVSNEPAQNQYSTPPDNNANPRGIENAGFDDDGQGQSGFVLGLVDNNGLKKINEGGQDLLTSDMYAFCGINNNAGRYFFGYGNNTINSDAELQAGLTNFKYSFRTNSTYVANDRVGIAIDRGKIRFPHQRDGGALTADLNATNASETRKLDYNRTYSWVVCFIGTQAKTRLTQVEAIGDPFFKQPAGLLTTDFGSFIDQASLGAMPPAPQTAQLKPVVRFSFRLPSTTLVSNPLLQRFLGFVGVQDPFPFKNFVHFNVLTCNQAHEYIAQNAVHTSLGFESYIIVLHNIPLEGYDTNISGKKSILYTIVDKREPNNPVGQNHIAFNSQYPIYMKIDNKNPLSLRQVKATIVNERYDPIETLGVSSLTMLIKGDK